MINITIISFIYHSKNIENILKLKESVKYMHFGSIYINENLTLQPQDELTYGTATCHLSKRTNFANIFGRQFALTTISFSIKYPTIRYALAYYVVQKRNTKFNGCQ